MQQASIGLGTGTIQLSGSYRLAGEDPWVDLKVAAAAVPMDELQSLMTAAGVKLPNGTQLKGGTLTLALEITGAANDLAITGPVELQNAQLVGYDLGSKIQGIAALGGVKTGSTTTIQSMKFDLQASNAGIQVKNIDGTILGMGTVHRQRNGIAQRGAVVSPCCARDQCPRSRKSGCRVDDQNESVRQVSFRQRSGSRRSHARDRHGDGSRDHRRCERADASKRFHGCG